MPSIIQWVEDGDATGRVLYRHSSDECPCSFPNMPKHFIFIWFMSNSDMLVFLRPVSTTSRHLLRYMIVPVCRNRVVVVLPCL